MKKLENKLNRLKEEGREIQNEVREKVTGYIGAGLGVIVSLAWNEAIKALIEYIFPLGQDTILAKFLYAGIMTILLVFVTVYLMKVFQKKEATKEK